MRWKQAKTRQPKRGFINAHVRCNHATAHGRKRITPLPHIHLQEHGLCNLVIEPLHSNIRLPYP